MQGSLSIEAALKMCIRDRYSPVNRCFKSSLALTIGQVVAKREAVLYLNLEMCIRDR